MIQKIEIDGWSVPDPQFHRYAIRWHQTTDGDAIPVLYVDGKRLASKGWLVVLDVTGTPDLAGGNANTE